MHIKQLFRPRLGSAIVLLFCTAMPLAAGALTIHVAAQEHSAPKFVGAPADRARFGGICPDIMAAIEQLVPDLHFAFDAQAQPLKRIENNLERGRSDANCLIDDGERRARFTVVPTRLFSFDYHLISRSGDPVRINGWNDVRELGTGGTVLVVNGSGAATRLAAMHGIVVEEGGKSATANLQKLALGRGRFFYYRVHEWENALRLAGVDGAVRILPMPMETMEFRLMFGKHVARDTVAQVERALLVLDNDGSLARIRDKWHIGSAADAAGAKAPAGG